MSEQLQTLSLTRPDDFHVHLRDDSILKQTVPASARQFGRCIVMPNLVPPVTIAKQATAYRNRILANIPKNLHFTPLMTLYLTDQTTPKHIDDALATGHIPACKLYPAGATTNSDAGVTRLEHLIPTLERMAELGMPLLIHGEVTQDNVDIFDREAIFIDKILLPLTKQLPSLKVVLEHITTRHAVEFVTEATDCVAATITPQHLMYNRNHMLVGGIHPHLYCLPILKRDIHQQALQKAATSGNPKFFLGTDSAPHAINKKESCCGCAGCYSSFAAIELYTEIFDQLGHLDKLEAFASHFGADFYGIERNIDNIQLIKKPWKAPSSLDFGENQVIPLRAGEWLQWQMIDNSKDLL
jgi:dihydroorotase